MIYYQKVNNKTYFYQDQFIQKLPEGDRATWFFDNAETGSFYVESVAKQKVEDYLSFAETNEWEDAQKKLNSHKKACGVCNIHLDDPLDLLPINLLEKYYSLLNKATENYVKKNNVNLFNMHVSKVASLIQKIKTQKVKVDFKELDPLVLKNQRNAKVLSKMKEARKVVDYDVLGSKTGRLTNNPDSIPVLTLKKELRKVIKPQNDLFAELDYNAAEARVLLALSGLEQPEGDIHDWNIKNVFRDIGTREEAKTRFFAWLYNPSSDDYLLDRHYDRNKILDQYFDGKKITNLFGREIESDQFHALNYLIQSTCADLVLEQAVKLDYSLKNKKSKIAFIIHDSIIVDVAKEDFNNIKSMVEIFSNTRLGKFQVNLSGGKNFGEMKKI